MAASGAERRPRRGPAPIASFDHDVSDEVSSNVQIIVKEFVTNLSFLKVFTFFTVQS